MNVLNPNLEGGMTNEGARIPFDYQNHPSSAGHART